MDKQQTLRGDSSGAGRSRPPHEGAKSFAAQPRPDAPHRIVDRRNQITAGNTAPLPAAPRRDSQAPATPPSTPRGRRGER
jgi:hypothetical protein